MWSVIQARMAVLRQKLPGGASDSDLLCAEHQVGMPFPPIFREVLIQHDGMGLGTSGLMSLAQVLRKRKQLASQYGTAWSPYWLPICIGNERLSTYYLDLRQSTAGDPTVFLWEPDSAVIDLAELTRAVVAIPDFWNPGWSWPPREKVPPRRLAEAVWIAVEAYVEFCQTGIGVMLPRGASPRDLDDVERRVGRELPPVVRALYEIHDGIGDPSFLMSLSEVVDMWDLHEGVREDGVVPITEIVSDDAVKPVYWSRFWLPLTADGAGNHLVVDLDPTEAGTYGQIVEFWHDDVGRRIVAQDAAELVFQHTDYDEWLVRRR